MLYEIRNIVSNEAAYGNEEIKNVLYAQIEGLGKALSLLLDEKIDIRIKEDIVWAFINIPCSDIEMSLIL